jgi:hypothetical protein
LPLSVDGIRPSKTIAFRRGQQMSDRLRQIWDTKPVSPKVAEWALLDARRNAMLGLRYSQMLAWATQIPGQPARPGIPR